LRMLTQINKFQLDFLPKAEFEANPKCQCRYYYQLLNLILVATAKN
jgi:hypothetical protein